MNNRNKFFGNSQDKKNSSKASISDIMSAAAKDMSQKDKKSKEEAQADEKTVEEIVALIIT